MRIIMWHKLFTTQLSQTFLVQMLNVFVEVKLQLLVGMKFNTLGV